MTVDLSELRLRDTDASGWTVYAHVTAAGDVLYVGCTKVPRARQSGHKRSSPWWPQVARVAVVDTFEVKQAALDCERALIESLQPPHNLLRTERETEHYHDVARRRYRPSLDDLRGDVERAERVLDGARKALAEAMAQMVGTP